MDNTDEILVEFIEEAKEILDQLDLDFVMLEAEPDNNKLIGNIFRGLHTLKGSSGFFALKRLEKLTHAGETLLGKVRDGTIAINTSMVSVLLSCLDELRKLISGIETNQVEPPGDDSHLIEQLLNLSNGVSIPLNSEKPFVSEVLPPSEKNNLNPDIHAHEVQNSPPQDEVVPESELNTNLEEPVKSDVENTIEAFANESSAPVKVNLELLDKLMNLVSEMVLARNRLLPFTNEFDDHQFSNAVRNIDLLTQELQERMMMTRMQPISQIWSKFPRLIRDVSNECQKKVNLIQIGSDTELDRTLIDAIRDPLVHIIRNCIDHGIEAPINRLSLGKPEIGQVLLKASHENGMVVIEISDDGGGINFELVSQTAVAKKLITSERALTISEMQLLEYIFLPGFSTKSVVTNLSGRGVGMDVVKNNISKIGGSVEINSYKNKGTNIRLKIPLTLAVMPALFVRCEKERYAIPQNSIVEMVRIDLSSDHTGLEDFYGTPVFRLRNKLVPLLLLNQQLHLSNKVPDHQSVIHIALLQSAGIQFGLLVDEVLNMQEVVVKPLGPLFAGISDFAGATILGDGSVALILDTDGIASSSGLVEKIQAKPLNPEIYLQEVSDDLVSMLVFELPGLHYTAIPLECVDRLESFTIDQIQKNGSREVVPYGDGIMQLIRINEYIDGAIHSPPSTDDPLSVITHYVDGVPMGLVVGKVHDITQVPSNMHQINSQQRGLKGCVIHNGSVINIIDIKEILRIKKIQDSEIMSYHDKDQSPLTVIDWKKL